MPGPDGGDGGRSLGSLLPFLLLGLLAPTIWIAWGPSEAELAARPRPATVDGTVTGQALVTAGERRLEVFNVTVDEIHRPYLARSGTDPGPRSLDPGDQIQVVPQGADAYRRLKEDGPVRMTLTPLGSHDTDPNTTDEPTWSGWHASNVRSAEGLASEIALLPGVAWVAVASLGGAMLLAYGLSWPAPIQVPRGWRSAAPLVAGGLFALVVVAYADGSNAVFPRGGDEGPIFGPRALILLLLAAGLSGVHREREPELDGRHLATVAGTFLVAPWLIELAWGWPEPDTELFFSMVPLAGSTVLSVVTVAVLAVGASKLIGRLELTPRQHLWSTAVRRGLAVVIGLALVVLLLLTPGYLVTFNLPLVALVPPWLRELWVETRAVPGRAWPADADA